PQKFREPLVRVRAAACTKSERECGWSVVSHRILPSASAARAILGPPAHGVSPRNIRPPPATTAALAPLSHRAADEAPLRCRRVVRGERPGRPGPNLEAQRPHLASKAVHHDLEAMRARQRLRPRVA